MGRRMAGETQSARGPLAGLRVVDAATLVAGPLIGTIMADFGADVIKVEHPRGDPLREHGYKKNDIGLWWKFIGRNKRTATLDLSKREGQDLLVELLATADVFIENFRPGTLERWNLAPTRLHASNSRLVIVRMTGFGQTGPYARRPGFGTLAEAMSGFAFVTGQPDGPPTLPPFGLADGIAGLAGAIAAMLAIYARDASGQLGQVVDVAIIEPILTILGPLVTVFDQLGIVQHRMGNRSINNAPRNTYQTRDGRWVAISASTQSVAERVAILISRDDLIREPWFRSGSERAAHADEIDAALSQWIGARDLDTVIAAFERAEAAVAPIYSAAEIERDEQYEALGSLTTVMDEDLGPLKMQNLLFRMTGTPGGVRWAGRRIGQDNESVYSELGIDGERLASLKSRGVV